ncbi:MAG TPA: hypothetical protein VNH22_09630, partial [Blastocatellia bacterium]|nr:hypothetical protein [Blastocatellia bacterium]
MKSDTKEQAEIRSALEEAFRQVSGRPEAALGEFAELQERRIERLKATEEYLKTTLGEDHPEVVALGAASKETEKLKDALRARAEI